MSDRFVVAIPEPFPEAALAVLDERFEIRQGRSRPRFTEDELIEFIGGAQAVAIYSRDRINQRVLDASPALRVIAKGGSRPTSNVDIDAAEDRVFSRRIDCLEDRHGSHAAGDSADL